MEEHRSRPSWDNYFFRLAKLVASRSTCPRAACGCVLVSEKNRILATGYNGVPSGYKHCYIDGCTIVDGHCVHSIHAEENAVLQLKDSSPAHVSIRAYVYRKNASGGSSGDGCCPDCTALLKASSIKIVGCWDE